jgi:hypothetical protein
MKLASNLGSKVNLFASGFTSVLGKDARACPKFAALLKLIFLNLAHLQKSNSFSFTLPKSVVIVRLDESKSVWSCK